MKINKKQKMKNSNIKNKIENIFFGPLSRRFLKYLSDISNVANKNLKIYIGGTYVRYVNKKLGNSKMKKRFFENSVKIVNPQIKLLANIASKGDPWGGSIPPRVTLGGFRGKKILNSLLKFSSVFFLVASFLFSPLFSDIKIANALTTNEGDGIYFYAATANTTPQWRTFTNSTTDFSTNSGTVAGAQPAIVTIKTSPTKQEAIAGYQDTSGNLRVMCYDGTSWTEDWTVAVAASGTPTTRAFDIAYETSTGDVTVAYGRNTAATNALGYRTKAGSSGCGSGNWAAAANFPTGTAATSATVKWVKAIRNGIAGSNLSAWVWLDNAATNADLGGAIWDGSAFTNFKAIETSMEHQTSVGDSDNFDVQYESLSGDVMVVWGNSAGASGTNGYRYMTCTGGTSSCTWSALTTLTGPLDEVMAIDLSADPLTDRLAMAGIGGVSFDLSAGYWSGSAWTGYANVDTSAETTVAVGSKRVTTGWLNNNGNKKWYLSYDDATGTGLSYKYAIDGAAITSPADYTSSPALNDLRGRYENDNNPFNDAELIQTVSDTTANNNLFAFKLSMDTSGNLSWSNVTVNGSGATALGSKPYYPQQGGSFNYWKYVPTVVTLGDGTDGGNSTIAPGASATEIDRFSLSTNTGTDTVTGMTVTLAPAGAFNNLATVGVYTTGDVLKCSSSSWGGDLTVELTSCDISVTTTSTEYVVKITPLSHAAMPAVPGASYATTATVTAITATNSTAGTDTDSATITVDNASPAGVTSSTATAGNTLVNLAWTNPADSDFTTSGTVVVLRRATSAVADVPVEGTTYTVGNTIGTATVACVVTGSPPATTCSDTSLTNGTVYHYKIFTQDSRGNYDAGVVPTGSPATPSASGSTISGIVYTDDAASTAFDCSATSLTLRVAVNGTLSGTPVACTLNTGAYSITGVTGLSSGAVVSVFVDTATSANQSATITRAVGSGDLTGLQVIQGRVTVRDEDGTSITNANLGQYDADDNANIPFTSNAGALSVTAGHKLLVWTGKTFTPGGTVTTAASATSGNIDGDILIQSTATLAMGTNALSVGGDFTNSGTLTYGAGQTTTFTATGTGFAIEDGTSNFDSIIFNGSGGGWSLSSALVLAGDLTVTAGTLSGNNNITINGGDATGNGTINLTSGTFTMNTVGNFGGDTAWTFSGLTIGAAGNAVTTATGTGGITVSGVLTIDTGDTLNAGSKTWTLSGSGTPLVVSGTFTPSTSTFQYTGTTATNITATTYYNLSVLPSANLITHTAAAGTITVNNNLTIGNGTNTGTFNLDTNDPTLDVNGDVTIAASGTLVASASAATTFGGNYTNSGTFTNSNGTITFDATSTGKTLSGTLSGFSNVTFNGSGGGWSFVGNAIVKNLTVTAGTLTGTGNISVEGGNLTGNGTINMTGGFVRHQDISGNFGGDGNWTFNELRLGGSGTTVVTATGTGSITVTNIMIVSSAGNDDTFNAGSKTYILSGSDTPLVNNGTFNAQTSTFQYTGTTATNIAATTYNNLSLIPAGTVTHTLGTAGSQTIRTDGTFLIGNGTNVVTATGATWNPALDIRGDMTIAANAVLTRGSGLLTFKKGSTQTLTDNTTGSGQNLGTVQISVNTTPTTLNLATKAQMTSLTIDASQIFSHNGANTLTLSGTGTPFVISGTYTPSTGTVSYTGATANLTATTYNHLTLSSGTYTAPAGTLTISGNYTNGGTFTHNSGTVVFNDSAQVSTLSGATTFNNLSVTTANKTIKFTSGQTFTTNGLLTLTGTAGNPVIVTSSDGATQWLINHQGTESVDYITVSYSGCDGASTNIDTTNSTSGASVGSCWGVGAFNLDIQYTRWFNDNGDESGASPAGLENTDLVNGVGKGDRRRIRFVISNEGNGSATNITYLLEQASSSCSAWIPVPTTQSNGTHWIISPSSKVINLAPTTNSSYTSDPSGKTFTPGYFMDQLNQTSAHSITSSQYTEHEFSVRSTNDVTQDIDYCFRLTNAGSITNFTYTQTPRIYLASLYNPPARDPGGTLEQNATPGAPRGGGAPAGGGGLEGGGSGPPQGGGSPGGGGGDLGFYSGSLDLLSRTFPMFQRILSFIFGFNN